MGDFFWLTRKRKRNAQVFAGGVDDVLVMIIVGLLVCVNGTCCFQRASRRFWEEVDKVAAHRGTEKCCVIRETC